MNPKFKKYSYMTSNANNFLMDYFTYLLNVTGLNHNVAEKFSVCHDKVEVHPWFCAFENLFIYHLYVFLNGSVSFALHGHGIVFVNLYFMSSILGLHYVNWVPLSYISFSGIPCSANVLSLLKQWIGLSNFQQIWIWMSKRLRKILLIVNWSVFIV